VSLSQSFFSNEEQSLAHEFQTQGYVIRDVEDRAALDGLRSEIASAAARLLERPVPEDIGSFLNELHKLVTPDKLNAFRLELYRELNAHDWFRPTYFSLARKIVEPLVGNELAMQNRINFSIQMPSDNTSLLDLHADSFTGETSYQVVQWLPLVDVWGTKSMFFLPRAKSEAISSRLKDFSTGGFPEVYKTIEPDLVWLEMSYGKVLIFSPNFLHGNVVNREPQTRWSLNTRFKGLFTPYGSAEKALGSYYLPITARPVTRVGMAYNQPSGFEE
jgi:sporadic carbohydrate cluster 2OG-Fe(II) oxygenase